MSAIEWTVHDQGHVTEGRAVMRAEGYEWGDAVAAFFALVANNEPAILVYTPEDY